MPAKGDPIDESFETRVIRNALGQFKELAALGVSKHQSRAQREAAEKLREKLHRTRKVDLGRPRYLEITRLERILLTVRMKKLDETMQRWRVTVCGRARPMSSDGSMASKAVRSTTFTMNVMMMRPKTLLRFWRPWPATGERFGSAQALRCPTSVIRCCTPLVLPVKSKRGQRYPVQTSRKWRESKKALRQVLMVGRKRWWPRSLSGVEQNCVWHLRIAARMFRGG